MIVMNAPWKGVDSRSQVEGFFADRAFKGLFAFSDIFSAVRPAPDSIQAGFYLFAKKPGAGHAWFADFMLLV